MLFFVMQNEVISLDIVTDTSCGMEGLLSSSGNLSESKIIEENCVENIKNFTVKILHDSRSAYYLFPGWVDLLLFCGSN